MTLAMQLLLSIVVFGLFYLIRRAWLKEDRESPYFDEEYDDLSHPEVRRLPTWSDFWAFILATLFDYLGRPRKPR